MEKTANLALPLLMGSQAQKHVTHNEALEQLDTLVHLTVLDDMRTQPPSEPLIGDLHIVAAGATADWAGRDGTVAWYTGNHWVFLAPRDGWRAWVMQAAAFSVFSDGQWIELASAGPAPLLGINTQADTTNRLSVKSDAILFSHDDQTPGTGDVRIQLNRANGSREAKVLFADAWSVRAEAGMAGDHVFRIKVSNDGSSFSPGLAVNTSTSNIGLGSEPTTNRLTVRQDQPAATRVMVANYDANAAAAAALRLEGSGGKYCNLELSGAGEVQALSNASMLIGTDAGTALALRTDGTDRLLVHGDGRVSVNDAVASAQFAVNGTVRVGSFAKAALPDAADNGAGALIFVSDATGGAVTGFSDGTNWRRTTDRSIVD